jgi:3-oxoacyl-[acyl-carrier protein] reductase
LLLKGKNAVVTGTNRGIGRAILETFASQGASVYAHARRETPEFVEETRALAEKYGVEIWPVFFDMTDYDAVKNFVKRLMSEKRPIDAVVNNAGITYNALFQMTSEEVLRNQFEVNFFSVFIFTQYMAKFMSRQKRGSIINIASTAGEDGNPGKSAYGASKAAVIAMTKSVASELGELGVRANCIAPGITETEMLETMPPQVVEEAKRNADLRRGGLPSEIAGAALFLASDMSSYVTGQVIRVDGGLR